MSQFSWVLLKEVRVKINILFSVLIANRVINVVEQKLQILCTLILDDYFYSCLEGHGNDTVEAFALWTRKESGLKGSHVPGTESEEISERRAHSRPLRSVPEHPNF